MRMKRPTAVIYARQCAGCNHTTRAPSLLNIHGSGTTETDGRARQPFWLSSAWWLFNIQRWIGCHRRRNWVGETERRGNGRERERLGLVRLVQPSPVHDADEANHTIFHLLWGPPWGIPTGTQYGSIAVAVVCLVPASTLRTKKARR